MKTLVCLLFFGVVLTPATINAQNTENLELLNAAMYVESRAQLINAWLDHCVKLNPLKVNYFQLSAEDWKVNNAEIVSISDNVLLEFKTEHGGILNQLKASLMKDVHREQMSLDIEHQLTHCDNFFNGIDAKKQDIAYLNSKDYNLLINFK